MSVVYTNHGYIDLDITEVFEATNGDLIALDNTEALLEAFHDGNISGHDMLNELCFDQDDLEETV